MKVNQNKIFKRFDKLFDDIYENLSTGWRSFPVDDAHVAIIVYQRILLECMDDDSLDAFGKRRAVKLWVAGYISQDTL